MKVYVAHDGAPRVRFGHETPGSESLGPWYGGTGAIRLRQVHEAWFWACRLRARAAAGGARPRTRPRDGVDDPGEPLGVTGALSR